MPGSTDGERQRQRSRIPGRLRPVRKHGDQHDGQRHKRAGGQAWREEGPSPRGRSLALCLRGGRSRYNRGWNDRHLRYAVADLTEGAVIRSAPLGAEQQILPDLADAFPELVGALRRRVDQDGGLICQPLHGSRYRLLRRRRIEPDEFIVITPLLHIHAPIVRNLLWGICKTPLPLSSRVGRSGLSARISTRLVPSPREGASRPPAYARYWAGD